MIELRSGVLAAGVVPHGARLAGLVAPDRAGAPGGVVLGLAEHAYPADRAYLGATVGRYANRIARGRFVLDGREHAVACNEPGAALHGGPAGLEHADFAAGAVEDVPGGQRVVLHHRDEAGGGFPGVLDVTVTYTLRDADLAIDIVATTDATTVVNLTNHAYWHLGGGGPVGGHEVRVFADRFLPVDEDLLPTGELAPVAGTPFDLRSHTVVDTGLAAGHPQLDAAGGYDHTFVLDGSGPVADGLRAAAHVRDPGSGRTLTVFTDQPGVQFYSGNMLDGSVVLHDGRRAGRREAFCLEPQHFPDSPNRPEFPSTVLHPGEERWTRILLRLGTDR